LTYS
jgi:hypothetical protein